MNNLLTENELLSEYKHNLTCFGDDFSQKRNGQTWLLKAETNYDRPCF